jgi:hypothetical protein
LPGWQWRPQRESGGPVEDATETSLISCGSGEGRFAAAFALTSATPAFAKTQENP